MKRLQAGENRTLRLIRGYGWYTRNDKKHSDLQVIKVKSFMNHIKVNVSARNSRNHYIKRLSTGSLVSNRRVPKLVHILDLTKARNSMP